MGPGAGGTATSLGGGRRSDGSRRAAGACRRSGGRLQRLAKPQRAPMQRHEGGYYIRLAAVDRPGTAATIARRMADENISLESIVQRGRDRQPHGGEDPQQRRQAGAGRAHHLCDQRGRGAPRARRDRAATACSPRSRRSSASRRVESMRSARP